MFIFTSLNELRDWQDCSFNKGAATPKQNPKCNFKKQREVFMYTCILWNNFRPLEVFYFSLSLYMVLRGEGDPTGGHGKEMNCEEVRMKN